MFIALILFQTVVSITPGFVEFVSGEANVRQFEQLTPGKIAQTGRRSHIEFSLGWNAFLRMDENSAAVLESADRTATAVQLQSGSGLIEVTEINKGSRITVTSGSLKAVINAKGVYRFSENTAFVISGKLTTAGSPSTEVGSGWQITFADGSYQRTKLSADIGAEFKRFMNGPAAGLVNAVEGEANVRLHERIDTDKAIQTGPGGRVELLLAPGSFLRLDENSGVVMESNFLKDTIVRVTSGTALLESVVLDPQLRTRVIVGQRKTRIGSTGLYQFTNNTAGVIEGSLRLELDVGNLEYGIGKGRQIIAGSEAYKESDIPVKDEPNEFEQWSARRSYELSTANLMAHFGDSRPNFFLFQSRTPNGAAWIYSPWLNGFTFVPVRRYESYYKQTFVPLQVLLPPAALAPVPNLCDFDPRCRMPQGFPQPRANPSPSPNPPNTNPEPAPTVPATPPPQPVPAPAPAPATQ